MKIIINDNSFDFFATSNRKNLCCRFYWDIIMTVTFLYIFVMVPHIICFYRIGKSSSPKYWNIVYPTYIVCIIDIFLNFITGFISSDGHEIFLDTTLVVRWLFNNNIDSLYLTDYHPFFSLNIKKWELYLFKQTLSEGILLHWSY